MNALFIWIPKAAGTSIQRALPMKRYIGEIHDMEKFDNEGFATFGHASIMTLINMGIILPSWYDHAFKFCFVRNPFDRMVSLYHHYLGRKRIKRGFNRFCKTILKSRDFIGPYNYKGFSQARPQNDWLVADIDFIGRVENLQDDLDIICKRLDLPLVKVTYENRSSRSHVRSYYNDELIKIVGEIYADDFDIFGYERTIQ